MCAQTHTHHTYYKHTYTQPPHTHKCAHSTNTHMCGHITHTPKHTLHIHRHTNTHSTYTETHNICTDTKTHIVYHIDTPPHTDTCTDTTQAHAHHTHCIHLCKSQCVQSCKCSDEIPQTRVCAEEPGQSPYCLPFVFRQIYDLKLRSWHSHSTEIAIIIY